MPRNSVIAKRCRIGRSIIHDNCRDRLLPATLAGMYVHRRFLVDPRIADLIAACAGIGDQEARQ